MKKYKAIIFDLGGVIINIDYTLTQRAFAKLGIDEKNEFYSKKKQTKIFDKLEIGTICNTQFLKELQKKSNNSTLQEIKDAWNSMLLDMPKERLDFIHSLKENYTIYLLSNTNSIHINRIKKDMGKKKWEYFISLFDKIYLSHEIGMRKPNKKAFQVILKENDLKPEEVLFIDDSSQHINSARELKINCHLLKKTENIVTLLLDKARLKHH